MSFTDFHKLKKYLLGIDLDEKDVESIEMAMLSDRDLSAEIDRLEAELIEDHIHGMLDNVEKERFENHFLRSERRRDKYGFMLALTEHASEHAAVHINAEAKVAAPPVPTRLYYLSFVKYASLSAVVIAAGIFGWYVLNRDAGNKNVADGLLALNQAYSKQRPTEGRLSDLDHAPWSIIRGDTKIQVDDNALTRAGLLLTRTPENEKSAESLRALAVFNAAQRKFDEALKNFDSGLSYRPTTAKFYSDHAAVLIETAKSGPNETPEKRMRHLEASLSQSDKALEIDRNYLPALFNKALCLQELNSVSAARAAWQQYLEKDPSSKWSVEANAYLKQLDEKKVGAKTPGQVLEDFLNAYEQGDKALAWKVAGDTKDMIAGTTISDQLTRGHLSADAQGALKESDHKLSALKFLGRLEQENAGDLFFLDLAAYYETTDKTQREKLARAHQLTSEAYDLITQQNRGPEAMSNFKESERLFKDAGNTLEAARTSYWISYLLGEKELDKSHEIAATLREYGEKNSYKWLYVQAMTQISSNYIRQSKYQPAIEAAEAGLKAAREISDTYSRQKLSAQLADAYSNLNDPRAALKHSQASLNDRGPYFNSARQAWRNFVFAMRVSHKFGLGKTAVVYANECVTLNAETIRDPGMAQNSFFLLSASYLSIGDHENAIKAADESVKLSGLLSEPSRTNYLASSMLQKAHAERLSSDHSSAIRDYNETIALYIQQGRPNNLSSYYAQKGRLLSYEKLGMTEQIEAEMPGVLALAETLRSDIEQDDIKTSFFAAEQDIYEFAANQALRTNNIEHAFDHIESGKARSLLDNLSPKDRSVNSKNVLTLSQIRVRIPENSQVVQYAVLPDKLLIWVIDRRKAEIATRNISSAELDPLVRELMRNASNVSPDNKKLAELQDRLHSLLLQPVEHLLDKNKDIIIVPDKILCYLPFEVLRPQGGKYAIEDHRFSYAPSATLFVMLSERAATRTAQITTESFLGVGNPEFDRVANPDLRDLSAAETEINASAEFYRGAEKIKFNGSNASKEKVVEALPRANVFHFAGHYKANDISPTFSKLLINSASGTAENDLSAADIGRMDLKNSKLVVLSACETAIENYYNGEGAIGIARTFFAAGAPVVVASRWEVDSAATSRLMTAFHRHRQEQKLSAAAALRAAQLEILQKEDQALHSPYFWAAFAAVGGVEKM